MSKRIGLFIWKKVRFPIVAAALFVGARELLRQDQLNYRILSAKCIRFNDKLRDTHQKYRKHDLFASAHGECVEINGCSGVNAKFLPKVSRYYTNEQNPSMVNILKNTLLESGLPVNKIESTSALAMLKKFPSQSIDTVIYGGGLRYESPENIPDLIDESYRVLRSGGKLLFIEDTHPIPGIQFSPLLSLRCKLRSYLLNEQTHDFVPKLLQRFQSAYIEDWSCPPRVSDNSPREHVKVLLPYSQRKTELENIQLYESNIPKFSPFSFLYRPVIAGYAIKPTPRSDPEFASGRITMATFAKTHQLLKDIPAPLKKQKMIDEKAKKSAQDADVSILEHEIGQKMRLEDRKPTPPRGGYIDNTSLDKPLL